MPEKETSFELENRQHTCRPSTIETRRKHVVCVRKACKHYGSKENKIIVLNDLDMTVPKGTIYGLLGSSGCGKTTLLNCIIGRMKLNAGELWVLGGSPGTKGSELPGPRIGYMPQKIELFTEFTIRETMKYFGWIARMTANQIEDRLRFLTDLLKLPEDNQTIKALSGGQQRRVSLAVVLLHEADLLILDEPTVGLDPVLRETIWNHLRDITKDGTTTVIITTHYIEETRHAHLIGFLRGGYIVAEESPSSILNRFALDSLEEVFLKLSIMQNMHHRRRTIPSQFMTDGCAMPSKVSNDPVDDSGSEISSDFGDGIFTEKYEKRFSLVRKLSTLKLTNNNCEPKVTDYLIRMNFLHLKALIWKNFLWHWRNWPLMLPIIAMPVLSFALFYVTIGHAPAVINVAIFNQEDGNNSCGIMQCNSTTLGCHYLKYLRDERITMIPYSSQSKAINSVITGLTHGSIIIQHNYSSAIRRRLQNWLRPNEWDLRFSTIDVYRDSSAKGIAMYLDFYLVKSFFRFAMDYLESCDINKDVVKIPFKWNNPVYGNEENDFTEFAVPGIISSTAFFFAATLTAVTLLIEKNEGIFERSLVMGVTPIELLISHIISESTLMLVQVFSLVICGISLFHMTLRGSTVLVMSLVTLIGFCGMWFGFALSSACKRDLTATYILLGAYFLMIVMCGIMWPIEGMIYELRMVTVILPLTSPVESLRSIMQRGWGLFEPTVYNGCITISAWTLLFIIISVVVLKFKKA
ncbi:hypothetical protein RI129_001316 [Pyrocoelia pectoralis]|uniref:ABC transporter G family member 23 n=1 Tax=Pyrocoelia pectoralis TaxID=417401 RepID=A0AAN7ZPM2_9COLE